MFSSQANIRKLQDIIAEIITSNEHIYLKDTTFDVHFFKKPRGWAWRQILNLKKHRFTKQIFTQKNNNDSICGARTILVDKS